MYNCNVLFLVVFCVDFLSYVGAVSGAERSAAGKPAVEVTSPRDGANVPCYVALVGRLNGNDGWPVVAIQPIVSDQPWYIQAPVDSVDDGEFTVNVYFGDDRTPAGTKFRVVVLVAPSEASAATRFRRGDTLKTLPKIPRSRVITVIRG